MKAVTYNGSTVVSSRTISKKDVKDVGGFDVPKDLVWDWDNGRTLLLEDDVAEWLGAMPGKEFLVSDPPPPPPEPPTMRELLADKKRDLIEMDLIAHGVDEEAVKSARTKEDLLVMADELEKKKS